MTVWERCGTSGGNGTMSEHFATWYTNNSELAPIHEGINETYISAAG